MWARKAMKQLSNLEEIVSDKWSLHVMNLEPQGFDSQEHVPEYYVVRTDGRKVQYFEPISEDWIGLGP